MKRQETSFRKKKGTLELEHGIKQQRNLVLGLIVRIDTLGGRHFSSRTLPPQNGLSYINTALLHFKIVSNERE
jgi:hypothetical protein